jgi:hypothetical protein
MGEIEKTRPYLESLTTRELIRMADREGIDIPPDLERVFIIQELLESENPESSPEILGKHILNPVPLPKQYNITFLEIMIRDPHWVFAFWEIKSHDKQRLEESPDFDSYSLRLHSLDSDTSFTVRVGNDDTAWYLSFPPQGGSFKVELLAIQKKETILAVSKPFTMLKLLDTPENEACLKNPLVRLSGAERFSVLRNTGLSRTSIERK